MADSISARGSNYFTTSSSKTLGEIKTYGKRLVHALPISVAKCPAGIVSSPPSARYSGSEPRTKKLLLETTIAASQALAP